MNEAMREHRMLSFRLVVDDGWPPVSVESLPFRRLSEGYELQVAPLYIKDLCVGDIIHAIVSEDGIVETWSHLTRSDHSTVWLLRLKSPNNICSVLASLRALGCGTVGLDAYGTYAIDVPKVVEMADVDRSLAALDPKIVAVAFPTIRHPNS